MAADLGTVELKFAARLDQLEAGLNAAKSKASRAADDMGDDVNHRLGSKLGKLGATVGKAAALGVAGAAVGVGAVLKGAFEAAEESRKVGAQTAAVIASTGGAANVSSAQVAKYSDKLAALTGIDDELIASGQNMLLTFTNVRNEAGKGNDIFDQSTKAALNMSVALGKDLPSSAMLVGKALNDPIKGMTALTKSGIQFTAQQKDQVAAMVKAGDVMGAQKIILKELETQFGGSAEAAASPMARLKVVVGNLQEELGARLLPVVGKVATFLSDNLPGALDRVGAVAGPVFAMVSSGFRAVVEAFKQGGPGVESHASGFIGVMERIGLAVRSVVDWIKSNWPQIRETIGDVVGWIMTNVVPKVQEVASFFIQKFGEIVAWVRDNWPAISEAVSHVVNTVKLLFEKLAPIVERVWNDMKTKIDVALNIIMGVIETAPNIINGDWGRIWDGMKNLLASAWDAMFQTVRNGVANIVDKFLGMVETIVSGAARAFSWVPGIGPKLEDAAQSFREFRDNVNFALRGIQDRTVYVNVVTQGGDTRTYGGEAGGRFSPGIQMAKGGFINSRTWLEAGEDGRELILPLTDMNRTRQLLRQAGLLADSGVSALGHSGAGNSSAASSEPTGQRPIGPFIFNGVRQDDLATEIPRRLRGALHLWDR